MKNGQHSIFFMQLMCIIITHFFQEYGKCRDYAFLEGYAQTITILHRGVHPNLLQYYMGRGRPNLIQY